MAFISDIVSAISEVEGLSETNATQIARYARESGYLSQGARGRNAPKATAADCANLLIALNAGGCIAKEAPEAIEPYRRLVCHAPHGSRDVRGLNIAYGKIEPDELRFLDRHGAMTFGEALESIVDRFIGGELERYMKSEAFKYLNEGFLKGAAERSGGDAKKCAAEISKALDGFLHLETVSFSIEFHRPNPFVRITIDRSVGAERELIAGVSFMVDTDDLMNGRIKQFGGDRRERTVIGYRTLSKIAEVMRR
jgi:hypothetical protein